MRVALMLGFLVATVVGVAGQQDVLQHKVVATSKTSTMEKELNEAADAGFRFQQVMGFSSTFGGEEVVVILERDKDGPAPKFSYRLMATSKTSTLEKELGEAGGAGYEVVGMTVGKTALGGKELVAITRKALP